MAPEKLKKYPKAESDSERRESMLAFLLFSTLTSVNLDLKRRKKGKKRRAPSTLTIGREMI